MSTNWQYIVANCRAYRENRKQCVKFYIDRISSSSSAFALPVFVSGAWGCRDRSVLLTPAAPRPPASLQRSGGRGTEKTGVPVSAQPPAGAPRWRLSSNWEGCPTRWAALFTYLVNLHLATHMLRVVCCYFTHVCLAFQEEQDIKALQAKNRKLGEALDLRQVNCFIYSPSHNLKPVLLPFAFGKLDLFLFYRWLKMSCESELRD